ncbi:MAG TPA: hypothetical protein VGP07_03170 [Polyangia bacterium]|jgi:hypothetical protein
MRRLPPSGRALRATAAFILLSSPVALVARGRAAEPPSRSAPQDEPEFDVPPDDDGADQDDAASDDAEPEPTVRDLAERMAELERRLAESEIAARRNRPIVTVSGYIDSGFFAPQGNGSGVVQDVGPAQSRYFPEYANRFAWVFLGDLLSPAVNSRGEPADLGNLPGVNRQDTIRSGGAPGFIVNEVNLTMQGAVGEQALATASVNYLPRSGTDFSLGDTFDVDLAQLEWMPTASRRWSFFVGKMESVVGIEYRERKARDRFGITPSLIARYTTGNPLGLKVRGKLGTDDWFIVALALTNGSSTTETFHFYDEVDSNAGKTASGRLAVRAPSGIIEVGASGAYGPQDHARDSRDAMWFVGADLQLHHRGFDLKGQYLFGRAPGEQLNQVYSPDHRPYGLHLNAGAYLEANLMVLPFLGFIARGELRDALVWLGNPDAPGGGDRIYITKSWRATGGIRIVPNEHIALKAEYLRNGEYGRIPSIRNDVFVTSLVLSY